MAKLVDSYQWIYPPDWNQVYPSQDGNLHQGTYKAVLQINHYWDATADFSNDDLGPLGDLSDFRGVTGQVVKRLVIEKVDYMVYGVNLKFQWKRTSTIPAYQTIFEIGLTGGQESGCIKGPFVDPGYGDGTDGTGGVRFTSVDGASKDTMQLTLYLKFKESPKPSRAHEAG